MNKRTLKDFFKGYNVIFYIIIMMMSFVAENNEMHLIYGLTFSFTNIFLLIILLTYGLWPGVAAAFIVMTVSIIGFHKPMIDFISVIEIIFLGIMMNNRSKLLLLWDGVFWLVLGIPLMIVTYVMYDGTLSMESTLVITTIATNSLFNALIAEMVDKYMPNALRIKLGQDTNRIFKLGQVLFHFSITAVALPYFIFVILNSWNLDKALVNSTLQQASNTVNSLNLS